MGVKEYTAGGRKWFRIDLYLRGPDGRERRHREGRIPNRELADKKFAKLTAEAYEGKHFDRVRPNTFTVGQAWELFEKKSKRCDSHAADKSRSAILLHHLAERLCVALTPDDIETYRENRRLEKTRRGGQPSDQTLDHEQRLLNRMLNWAAKNRKIPVNPIRGAEYLDTPNVRKMVIDDEAFERLIDACVRTKR